MSETTHLVLRAPLSGVVVPLENVPDPVFAQRMVGDGVSIDPITTSLVAPCDGRVVQIHSAGHAVTLASNDGIEVLMHIGLDTVQLKGRGFTARVKTGDVVRAGDVLINFDADYVATHARSLMTEIIITATKREENVQNVPINVIALGTRRLDQLNISNFEDYTKQLPSVSFLTTQPGVTVLIQNM